MKLICPIDRKPCERKTCAAVKYCALDRRKQDKPKPSEHDDRARYDRIAGPQ